MSLGRRILLFPLTRLSLWIVGCALLTPLFGFLLGWLHLPAMEGAPQALAGLAALLFLARYVERRSPAEAGLRREGLVVDTGLGFLLGAVLMSAAIGLLAAAGFYAVTSTAWGKAALWSVLLNWLLHFLWVAIFEEIGFRGVFFRMMEEWLGSWIALALSAVLFGLLHLIQPHASLVAAFAIAVEAGILLGGAYMLTRSLWLAIGIHWAWNFFEGPIFGTAVSGSADGSGIMRNALLHPVWRGPVAWTGGGFGPEAGLATVLVATFAGVVMVALAIRRGRLVRPCWQRRKTGEQAA